MAQVILLGTGAALGDPTHENTFLVVQGASSSILVDAAGSPFQRLVRARVPPDSVEHLILTHHHPDHIYGLSVLFLDMWLAGRKKVLHVYGLAETLRAARTMLRAVEWERWREHGFFPVKFHRVPKKEMQPVITTSDFVVTATPTQHLLPTIATRYVSTASGKTLVYSSDTMVCDSVVELACDADILLHEATTVSEPSFGHSSARQAGKQAARAHVKELVLLHLPPNTPPEELRAAAEAGFHGKVVVARDMMRIKF